MSGTLPPILLYILTMSLFTSPVSGQRPGYPKTRSRVVTDDYHGTKIEDPYRWLEDDGSEDTRAWVKTQNRFTFGYLRKLPRRQKIGRRLRALWNFERITPPVRRGRFYVYSRNEGLQNQSILLLREGLEGKPRVLFDPNLLSRDGTVAYTGGELTEDGKRFVYGISGAGSDWREFHVRDVAAGEDLPDCVRWVKFADACWGLDGKGFYYSRYPEPREGEAYTARNHGHRVYYHRAGTPQSADELIYEDPGHPERLHFPQVTEDGAYLIITACQGTDTRHRVYYVPIRPDGHGDAVRLLDDFDAAYTFIGNDGTLFYFLTDLDAPRKRVVAVDTAGPEKTYWREILPEREDVLKSVKFVGGKFVASYLHDACSRIDIHRGDGAFLESLPLPALGTVSEITGREGDTEMFFSFESFTQPPSTYRYDLESQDLEAFHEPRIDFCPEDFRTEQVFFTSRDGTRVPMFLAYRRGALRPGKTPVYLYGYGGFHISLSPEFKASRLAWMEMGGVFAQVNLRGGGEYGKEWHRDGMLGKRQNVYDDFISAAEHLVDRGYTSREKIAIGGASNGGLLVGACMTQRPDLFAAALPDVGVFDMLRYHHFTIGWAWASDYGRSDDPEHFPFLLAQSPYHNLREGVLYPATLITTADHDDRVVPAHSFKFAARLQACQSGEAPVLIRIDTHAGHGAGKPTKKQIDLARDRLAFLAENLRMDE